ncbi:MAG: DUF2147 domain-containing protein [Dyella sp.]
MKQFLRMIAIAGLLLAAGTVLAAENTPVGTWRTIDDATGKPTSIVQISDHNGELQGVVKQILDRTPEDIARDGDPALCKECDGARKNQPIEGMTILWGVKQDGDVWDGGNILDPKNGKVYKVKLKTLDGGSKLDVHGYIGFSLLGRSQTWQRQD